MHTSVQTKKAFRRFCGRRKYKKLVSQLMKYDRLLYWHEALVKRFNNELGQSIPVRYDVLCELLGVTRSRKAFKRFLFHVGSLLDVPILTFFLAAELLNNVRRSLRNPTFPWPIVTELISSPRWWRSVLAVRHTASVAMLLPRPKAMQAWKIVRRSNWWIRYHNWEGTVPAGRCLLSVCPVTTQYVQKLIQTRDGIVTDNKQLDARKHHMLVWRYQKQYIRQLEAVINSFNTGHKLYRVRFFLNTLSRIDMHPWEYTTIVDMDSKVIVARI